MLPLNSTGNLFRSKHDRWWSAIDRHPIRTEYCVNCIDHSIFSNQKQNNPWRNISFETVALRRRWSVVLFIHGNLLWGLALLSLLSMKYLTIIYNWHLRPFYFPDLIAIPDMGGAMENWGLVTFRESAVLFDSSTGSVADKKLVTMIVDHELAHQVKLKCNLVILLVRWLKTLEPWERHWT